jgi:glutamine cyclotransferase
MHPVKLIVLVILIAIPASCGDNKETADDLFAIEHNVGKKGIAIGEKLSLNIKAKKQQPIDSVVYTLDGAKLYNSKGNQRVSVTISGEKLGKHTIMAKIHSDGTIFSISKQVTFLASEQAALYTYKILESYPHDIEAYTQGLEFENDTLYESTGKYQHSSLRKTDYKSGAILKKVPLEKAYFGEGLTILNNKIYQLTWQEKTGFIYDLNTLDQTGTFVYNESPEGWGLCNDGKAIFKSDGTEKIWKLNSNTLAEESHIEIYTNNHMIPKVNELEWVEGKIYANIYQKDAIAIVNPDNGAVEGVIDLGTLKDNVTKHEALDVLNGIAYNGEPNILYVTGKNWDKLFKIEIIKK